MTQRMISGLLAAMLFATAASAGQWNIDQAHSSVGFKIRHFFNKVSGEFGAFEGSIHFDPGNPAAASVEATIQAASVDTGSENRDKHLRSGDFFDVETHPTITFKSDKVEQQGDQLIATGNLTMNGVTRPVSFPIEFLGAGPDPWGGTRAGFAATLELDRKDFDITWNNALDHGGMMLGDQVEISLDIQAIAAKEPEQGR